MVDYLLQNKADATIATSDNWVGLPCVRRADAHSRTECTSVPDGGVCCTRCAKRVAEACPADTSVWLDCLCAIFRAQYTMPRARGLKSAFARSSKQGPT